MAPGRRCVQEGARRARREFGHLRAPTGLRPKAQRCPANAGLRWVRLPTRRQPQRGWGYFARVDHYWSLGFAHMRSNGAMGHNPVGVDISFAP